MSIQKISEPESPTVDPAVTLPGIPRFEPEPGPRAATQNRSTAWTVTIVFGVLILIPSLLGFVMKFGELMTLTQGVRDGGFAITPVINYLLASAGFFFLLLWAAVNGMFRDLERPKYLMLENERELDGNV